MEKVLGPNQIRPQANGQTPTLALTLALTRQKASTRCLTAARSLLWNRFLSLLIWSKSLIKRKEKLRSTHPHSHSHPNFHMTRPHPHAHDHAHLFSAQNQVRRRARRTRLSLFQVCRPNPIPAVSLYPDHCHDPLHHACPLPWPLTSCMATAVSPCIGHDPLYRV